MNAQTFSEAAENSLPGKSQPEDSAVESEISNLVEQEYAARPPTIEYDGERIKSSVALFTSKSIKELEGLTFELHGLQEFLKSETERVQRDIDNALTGLKIIIDTISPWRGTHLDSSAQEKTSKHAHEPRIQRFNLAGGLK
jgi:hypothetical protein